jgi:hypothetical protein
MEIKDFIKKAIAGGWRSDFKPSFLMSTNDFVAHFEKHKEKVLLDPLAWQAVGKVEGWGTPHAVNANMLHLEWRDCMYQMIGALIAGKTIEEYLKTL